MKAHEWERFFASQRTEHGKHVFTVSELANVASASPTVVNVMLARLARRGVVERVTRGIYAPPGVATTDDVLPLIAPGAYITGARVLFDAGFITQVPLTTLCFTSRRPFRNERNTSLGRLKLMVMSPPVYEPPPAGVRASPEQALFDLALTTDAHVPLRGLYTFRHAGNFRRAELHRLATRYQSITRDKVNDLLKSLQTS